MTQSIQNQTEPDFYLQVEDFILNTIGSDMDKDQELNNEVRLFLLTLLNHHKKQEGE